MTCCYWVQCPMSPDFMVAQSRGPFCRPNMPPFDVNATSPGFLLPQEWRSEQRAHGTSTAIPAEAGIQYICVHPWIISTVPSVRTEDCLQGDSSRVLSPRPAPGGICRPPTDTRMMPGCRRPGCHSMSLVDDIQTGLRYNSFMRVTSNEWDPSPLPEGRRERAIRRQAEGVREKEEVTGK